MSRQLVVSSYRLSLMDAIFVGLGRLLLFIIIIINQLLPGNGNTCEIPCPFKHALCRQHSGVFPGGGMMVRPSKANCKILGVLPR